MNGRFSVSSLALLPCFESLNNAQLIALLEKESNHSLTKALIKVAYNAVITKSFILSQDLKRRLRRFTVTLLKLLSRKLSLAKKRKLCTFQPKLIRLLGQAYNGSALRSAL